MKLVDNKYEIALASVADPSPITTQLIHQVWQIERSKVVDRNTMTSAEDR